MLNYFSGQGRVLLAQRLPSGMPGPLRWVGDDSSIEFSFAEDTYSRKENWSGARTEALRRTKEITGTLNTTLVQLNTPNIALLTRGDAVDQATTALTDQVIATTLPEVGDFLMLPAFNASAVAIKDSTGSPITLTADVNYALHAKEGSIEILDMTTGGPFTAPLKADLTPGAAEYVKMLSAAEQEYWFRFQGVNTAVSGNPKCVVDFYRWRASPTTSLQLISEEAGEFPVEGSVLADSTKTASGDFGFFGRMMLLDA